MTLQGPDHLDDNAPDVPFFLYGDQHHTNFPNGEFSPGCWVCLVCGLSPPQVDLVLLSGCGQQSSHGGAEG